MNVYLSKYFKKVINSLTLICISSTILLLFMSCVVSQNPWGTHPHKIHNKFTFYQRGMASYYAPSLKGLKTSNGETYDPNLLTAASTTLPINSIVMVKSVHSGRFVVVRINDRGPFAKGRVIDLSEIAAKKLGLLKKGVGKVEIYKIDIEDL